VDSAVLRTAVLVVEDCTRFVCRDDVPVNLKEKVHLELERLRRGCIRLLGARFGDVHPDKIEEVQRQAVEPSTPGAHRFPSEEPPTFTVASVKLLAAVVSHLISIAPKTILHVCRAVDSLIALARVSASGSFGLPSKGTSDYLEHALSILTTMTPPFSQEESLRYGDALRCISAAHWILATLLFQKDQFAAAVPYLIRTCEIAATLVSLPKFETLVLETEPVNAKLPSPSSRSSTIESITAQLPKRWELLGFCQGRTGDRKVVLSCSS
jgi:separase